MILPRRPGALDLGIGLVSFAVLLTELLLTRIFSVTMHYHLSFMVVSLAMLGFAASGLVVTLWPGWFAEGRLHRQAGRAAFWFALSTVAAVGLSFQLSITLEPSPGNWLRVAMIYLGCAIPFFCGGLVVSLILTHRAQQASRYYFFDLVGAALGCLVMIPASNWLGAPTAVLMTAAVACLAAAVLAGGDPGGRREVALVVGMVLVVVGLANRGLGFYDLRQVKGAPQPATVALRWNAFSRVDVPATEATLWQPHFPRFAGFSSRLDPAYQVPEVWLRYDADANTPLTYFDGNLERVGHLRFDVAASVYHLGRPGRVLVLGPGGGRDVLMALLHGAGTVTGVEINPLTVSLMRTRFRTFTGGLYDGYPGVNIVNDDGRSFLRRDPTRYDLMVASLVDTWAASSAGAYALTENNLYTVEAFQDFLGHLTPDGVLCLTRWFTEPPVEALRVVSLAKEALARRGVSDPGRHLLVVRTDGTDTVEPSLGSMLIKNSPFTDGEIAGVVAFAREMGFRVPYQPATAGTGPAAVNPTAPLPGSTFHRLMGPGAAAFVAEARYDLSAVSDDRPFFFSRVPLLPWLADRLGLTHSKWGSVPLGLGGSTLLLSLAVTLGFTLLLLLLPVLARRTGPARLTGRSGLWAAYFAALGLGFILIELALVQRFSVFLGYPVYGLAAVLFTMLLLAGVGSALAGRIDFPRGLPRVVAGLIALAVALALILPALLLRAGGAAVGGRITLAVVVVAPLALLMGMPFPSGVRRVRAEAAGLVPWAWAVNGASSVLGSILAVLVSMTWGLRATLLVGAGAYLVALGVALWLGRRPEAGT